MTKRHIVIDTNVYLSALLYGGNPRKVVETALLENCILVTSEEIYTEMLKVITQKFPDFLAEYQSFEALLRLSAVNVRLGSETINICRDPKDNMIIETTVIGGCEMIITGDKDLLVIKSYKKIDIVTPAEVVHRKLLGD